MVRFFFFKQKTAYEMRISDWSSDVCSSDLCGLVSERRTDRNVTRITLDEPTGSIETIVIDEDLQKTASSLLMDQFVMEKIVASKNGGFIVKDIKIGRASCRERVCKYV